SIASRRINTRARRSTSRSRSVGENRETEASRCRLPRRLLMASPKVPQAVLVALTPEAKAALGGAELLITTLPFRVGRESRSAPRAAGRTIAERRKARSRPTNDVYLVETLEPFTVS